MRSVAITCVKNEIDIIEAFVRHTLALVDHLVVLDNGSQDGTVDVLQALAKEGLPLEIVEDASPGQYQVQRMNRLMHEHAVAQHAADWVFALDGDEFLAFPEGSSLIPEGAAPDRPILLTWRSYVPDPSDNLGELNPVLRIRRRRIVEGREYAKVIVPRALAALPQAALSLGNHELLLDGQRCEPHAHPSCHLAHFPLRSLGQYATKIALTSLQYQAMARRDLEAGYHSRHAFELLKQDWRAFAASLSDMARNFALPAESRVEPGTMLDPLRYQGGPLRYTPRLDDTTRAWCALLCYAEDLARRYAVLAAGLTDDQQFSVQQQAALVADLYAQLEERRKDREYLRAINYAVSEEGRKEREHLRAINYAVSEERRKEQASFAKELAELHQSWTWKIGRLFVGPVAWARRSKQRCAQTLARTRLRIRPAAVPVGNLEIHVAHSCNLSCESCSHYANQGQQGIVALEEAERWMRLWQRRIEPRLFAMVGGEPAMHPHLPEFVRLCRKHWPNAELRLISNGFLLGRHPDLPAVLRDTNTCLCVSIHHPSPEYQEKLKPVRQLLDGWETSHGIRLEYFQSYGHWTRRYHGLGSAIEPFDDRQPRLSWETCPSKQHPQLFDGMIWKCAPLAYLTLQAKKYPLSDKWNSYLQYQPLRADCTPDELAAFFTKQDEPCCSMCSSKPVLFDLPLPFPAPVHRATRRLAA
jgi:uncharacterized radical SAM superfamily Fe-S cluster-containing enzyme